MSVSVDNSQPQARVDPSGEGLVVTLAGNWRITEKAPRWKPSKAGLPAFVCVKAGDLGAWDSSLLLYLASLQSWCHEANVPFQTAGLPESLSRLLKQIDKTGESSKPRDRSMRLFSFVGLETQLLWKQSLEISHFVGECVLSSMRLLRNPANFRLQDCLAEMQQCGAMALPIVGLVSFLIGVTLAYTGAIILRLFGGDIWVADLVGLSITREMGAVMTAVVLAGRTGAAYAAQLANMKANEELDALSTLGVSPIDFLVIPRLLALAVMTPLLTMYSSCLGIIGGGVIAQGVLEIPPTAYWIEMLTIVDLSDITTGLIKASTFGIIVGMSGCLRGLQADRSATGVGQAATSAVVTAILLMVVADSLYAVVFNILGW